MSGPVELAIAELRRDGGIQLREGLDEDRDEANVHWLVGVFTASKHTFAARGRPLLRGSFRATNATPSSTKRAKREAKEARRAARAAKQGSA